MSDKDKEAFKNWYINKESEFDNCKEAWEAACEYKQKEFENLIEQDKIVSKEIKTYIDIANRLQAENAELNKKLSTVWKEAEKFYLDD